jgi:hypothetical protein
MSYSLEELQGLFSRNSFIETLDLANINAEPMGKGLWTEFSKKVIEAAAKHNFSAVYVENVLEERFQKWFVRNNSQAI